MPAQPIPKTPVKGTVLEAWQQSLSEAWQVAKMILGHEASVAMAEHNSGIYHGVIIGHTRDYIVQQIGKQAAAVIHSKDLFHAPDQEFPWPEVGHAFSIHYSRSRAVARELRERLREQGLSR
ncbi:MAG TPA: hypothetical protein VMR62_07430 [Bryobacteraceae bacterium]|jgi:hypothetical protein|nr:hypothetical protein [Bryobacteraceae bacterium]